MTSQGGTRREAEMFESYSAALATEHIRDLTREAAAARLAMAARRQRASGSRRSGWLRRRRGHRLAAV
jgi:hypothetical protein